MRLLINHKTVYAYQEPAARIALKLRLFPSAMRSQHTEDWCVMINGQPVEKWLNNSAGDVSAHWHEAGPLQVLLIEASGLVITRDDHGIVQGLKSAVPIGAYLRSTSMTAPDAAITALAETVQGGTTLEMLHSLSAAIQDQVEYQPGVTDWETSAAQAVAIGQGVCQDQAQVFIAAARHKGVPARYVAGYYLADKDAEALHETHAWAEAYVPDLGWVGFDVTNGICVTDHHVRLCSGMDAHDAAPVRGAVFGSKDIAIDADVVIGEATDSAVAHMQQQQQQ
jgi:transglutaminase-like putative cysteine protease